MSPFLGDGHDAVWCPACRRPHTYLPPILDRDNRKPANCVACGAEQPRRGEYPYGATWEELLDAANVRIAELEAAIRADIDEDARSSSRHFYKRIRGLV